MNRKREKPEIIKDILGVILLNRNILKTNLLYKSNLSPIMFRGYTNLLIDKKLIKCKTIPGKTNLNKEEVTRGHKTFNLTEKGRQYLEDYKTIEMFLEKYGLNEE